MRRGRPSTKKRSFSSIRNRNKRKKEKEKALVKKKDDEKGLSNITTKIAYCEGVGNTVTGPVYKTLATSLVSIIVYNLYNKIVPWLSDKVKSNEYIEGATTTFDIFLKKMEKECEVDLSTWWGKIQSYTRSKKSKIACKMYDNAKVELKWNIDNLFEKTVNWILTSVFGIPVVAGGSFAIVKFLNLAKAVRMTLSKSNELICYVAGLIEKLVMKLYYTCTFKQKQDLIKSMGPELQLFDNSIKF